jgi:hypothetical protein
MTRILTLFLLLVLSVPMLTKAAEPPALEKADAQKIMEAMEWTEVSVIAIRQGVDAKGAVAPIYATIVGLGTFHNEHHAFCEAVTYDSDLGWYFVELRTKSARIWTRDGYREYKPWSTW